ncbi:MAG: mdcH [Herminiimonas sp.]|nr:mdcH [Herminiimonas sp.]
MTNRLAILCPGQAGQHQEMFELARTGNRVSQLLDAWPLESLCGQPLDEILAQDALLFSNRIAQPLVVAATLAAWEAIRDFTPLPALAAGYSVGEVASYAVAGALSAEDAISLAAERARLMDACLKQSARQSLLAVSGVSVRTVTDLLYRKPLFVAIEIGEDSVIVGGLVDAIAEIEPALVQAGARIGRLPVEIASHTPLMQAAVAPFAAEVGRRHFTAMHVPVLSGVSAELIRQKDHAVSALSRQIAETIRWADCMDMCAESGIGVALELGPGAGLSRMLQARHPQIECRSVADFRTIEGIKKWLSRHFD